MTAALIKAAPGADMLPVPAAIDKALVRKLRPHGPWFFAPLLEPEKAVRFDDLEEGFVWADERPGEVRFLPFGPHSTTSRLDLQRRRASAAERGKWTGKAAVLHESGRDALVESWAYLNGLRRTASAFTLDALSRGLQHGGEWGKPYDWPGCDHPICFRRGRQTAAVLTEPYRDYEVEALVDFAAERGLVAYMPANPKASFWFPGQTYFVVLMAWRAPAPRFLADQWRFRNSN